jgi:hypothetical protein
MRTAIMIVVVLASAGGNLPARPTLQTLMVPSHAGRETPSNSLPADSGFVELPACMAQSLTVQPSCGGLTLGPPTLSLLGRLPARIQYPRRQDFCETLQTQHVLLRI